MGKRIEIEGQVFSRLTVVSYAGTNKHGAAQWSCLCECGENIIAVGFELRTGHKKSCGCWRRDIAKALNHSHGLSMENGRKTETYRIWAGMNSRCNNPTAPFYVRYGGSGISVCERWQDYANFYQDMGDRPKNHSLDRIDSSGDYTPQNCRWATCSQQSQNRRKPSHNTSGTKNVSWRRSGWLVKVTSKGKRVEAGPFEDVDLAKLVAFELRRKLHGEFSCNG